MKWLFVAIWAVIAGCDLGHDNPGGDPVVNGASLGCSVGCHGQGDQIAPPRDTTGGTDTSLIGVGAHAQHLQASDWHQRITCETCHVVPEDVGAIDHIFQHGPSGLIKDPPPAELVFTAAGAGTQWDRASATCSNNYCHGDARQPIDAATQAAGGRVPRPVWTQVDGSQSQCDSCHGSPPPAPHPSSTACEGCHADAGPNLTIKVPTMHIDGFLQVSGGGNHPPGWVAPEAHGYDFDQNGPSTCATAECHGTTLTGGSGGGPSCQSCHTANWQSDCKFCHGSNDRGAPPAGVLGQTAASDPHVGAHAKHSDATALHAAWDCTVCHTQPSDALSPGHIDGEGGVVRAEVVFSSLNPASTFSFTSNTCANNYCHGGGQGSRTSPAWTSLTPIACVDGCHGGDPDRKNLSQEHRRNDHERACTTCHKGVVDSALTIINPALHLNGSKDVQFAPAGSRYDPVNKSCTGTGNGCHGNGTQDRWR